MFINHKIDVRVKIFIVFSYILAVVTTESISFKKFLGYLAAILFLIFIERVDFVLILKRTLSIFPFILFIGIFLPFSSSHGISLFVNILEKAWLSILSSSYLSLSISFSDFLEGLYFFHIPKIFITLFSLMERYMNLFLNEAKKMDNARRLRDFGKKRIFHIKAYTNIIGMLFIKTYEKSEDLYNAMALRGFSGEFKRPLCRGFQFKELLFSSIFLIYITGIKLWK